MRSFWAKALWGYFMILLVWVAASCGVEPEEGQSRQSAKAMAQGQALAFSNVSFEERSEDCVEDGPCARVVAVYPQADRGPEKTVAFVNDSILHYVRLSLSAFSTNHEKIVGDIDTLAHRFIRDYQSFRDANPDYNAPPWVVESKGKVLYQSPRVVSVELQNFSFTGGAHPNSFKTLLCFDLQERQMLHLPGMIKDEAKLNSLVEAAFRKFHDLGPEASFQEEGFFWDEGFVLSQNAALTKEGLLLIYNPYEVAPYATGETTLTIPYNELEGVLLEEYLVK